MTNDELRQLERDSIRDFVDANADLLRERVLDYGCGRAPFRDIVKRVGGTYIPYDRAWYPGNVSGDDVGPDEWQWGDIDAVLLTQVTQYVPDLANLLGGLCDLLRGGAPGALVATGPTTWPIIEQEDLHRHTPAGIAVLLEEAGFLHTKVEQRATIRCGDLDLVVGWQAVAYP